SERRRRTRATLFRLAEGLCQLLAPVMCHTADETYRVLHGSDEDACVHLTGFPGATGIAPDEGWTETMGELDKAMKALEEARATTGIDNPLDAGLVVPDPDGRLGRFDPHDLCDYCGVSRFSTKPSGAIEVTDLRQEPVCERSKKRDGTVRARSDSGMLSDRDAAAVGVG
ncbi:MAG: class I tRNA ligase family protein, partial [Planctomycetota bacterium]